MSKIISRRWIFTTSLLLPLLAVSANAYAGSTISDRSYWPNEARADTLQVPGDVASAYAFAGPAVRMTPMFNSDLSPRYQGGPKSNLPRGE